MMSRSALESSLDCCDRTSVDFSAVFSETDFLHDMSMTIFARLAGGQGDRRNQISCLVRAGLPNLPIGDDEAEVERIRRKNIESIWFRLSLRQLRHQLSQPPSGSKRSSRNAVRLGHIARPQLHVGRAGDRRCVISCDQVGETLCQVN